jgi:predicted outer membrane protein
VIKAYYFIQLKIVPYAFFLLVILVTSAQAGTLNGSEFEIVFLRQAYLNSLWRMESGKIAAKQTETTAVKNFAQLMVARSSTLCNELVQLLKKKGSHFQGDFSSTQKDTLSYLSRQRGAGIDREYISMAGDDLADDLKHYPKAFHQSKDSEIRIFAEKAIKDLKEDSVLADRILRNLPPPVLK